jgi:hypothetical protein
MPRRKVYYIDNNLEIKQGYTSANINKMPEVIIEYKNSKMKVSSDLVAESKESLNKQFRLKVIKLAENYGLKARWINDTLEITSKFDLWYVYENEHHKLVWVHKNSNGLYSNHEHVQKVMYSNQEADFLYIMRSISQHDTHQLVKHSKNRMMNLFDMIKTNNIPKIKIS